MQITSRFTIAIHSIALIECNKDMKVTSNIIAGSTNVNPVIVRGVLSQLKEAGIIHSRQGASGVTAGQNVTITATVDGVERAVTFPVPDDLDLPAAVDQAAIDSLCAQAGSPLQSLSTLSPFMTSTRRSTASRTRDCSTFTSTRIPTAPSGATSMPLRTAA